MLSVVANLDLEPQFQLKRSILMMHDAAISMFHHGCGILLNQISDDWCMVLIFKHGFIGVMCHLMNACLHFFFSPEIFLSVFNYCISYWLSAYFSYVGSVWIRLSS